MGPCLRRANDVLRAGALLDHTTISQLSREAERDVSSRREQHERHTAYLDWRDRAARRLARDAGPFGRLTHRAEDFYAQLDQERLRVCGGCMETIYPPTHDAHGSAPSPSCHYCREPHGIKPYAATSITRTESEAYE